MQVMAWIVIFPFLQGSPSFEHPFSATETRR